MAFIPFPAGTVLAYAGATAPSGWLMCDGTAYSRTEYADAYAAIGVLYGVGNGSTTFNVPDLRGVFMRGAGTNGTSNYGGVTGHTPAGGNLATKGGQKTAKNGLTGSSAGMSANTTHGHGVTDSGHTHPPLSPNTSFRGGGVNTILLAQGTYSGYNDVNTTGSSSTGLTVNTSASIDHTHAVTIGAGDTETAPAALAVNYIIKI